MNACRAPIAFETLVDYWIGDLDADSLDTVEAHLMTCDTCTARATGLAELAHGVRLLVRDGRVASGVTSALLERLERDGVRVRRHRVAPGGSVACTAGPDDDLIAMSLVGDFRSDERVDLVFVDAPGPFPARRLDVPVDRARGEVSFTELADVIRRLPAHVAILKLYGISETGERAIGEYTLRPPPWP